MTYNFSQMFLMLASCLLYPESLRQGWRMVFEKHEGCPFWSNVNVEGTSRDALAAFPAL